MKAAFRLMARFGVPEPLIGDIVEAGEKHSALWVWTQVLVAVGRITVTAVLQLPLDADVLLQRRLASCS
jgi:hypothetical protein